MGKRLFQEVYSSKERTNRLGLPELVVVSEADDRDSTDRVYHAVHETYFIKTKHVCPYCGKSNTAETKIRPRKFKDILSQRENKVIDLIFHQRYFRCNDCKHVFHEKIDFAEEGCRYTNRLSNLLAEGTLTQTYEQVCRKYGVPASKTSVGIIMRRRLRMKTEQLPKLATPDSLVIFVAYYYSSAYPVVLGIYGERVKLIDVLSESSESSYAVFFSSLDRANIKYLFIDPDEQLHSAAASAFPDAKIMISEECVQRYIRDAFKDIIRKDGSRCFIRQRYHTLSKPEGYLSEFEQKQIEGTMRRRHRLCAAYNAYQDILHSMASGWDIERVLGWVEDLPEYIKDASEDGEQLEPLQEFDIIKEMLYLYAPQVNAFLSLEKKPPAAVSSAVMSILSSLEEMPYCIYEVLHARMLLNVEHDIIMDNGIKYRIGIPVERLAKTMQDITSQIKKEKGE